MISKKEEILDYVSRFNQYNTPNHRDIADALGCNIRHVARTLSERNNDFFKREPKMKKEKPEETYSEQAYIDAINEDLAEEGKEPIKLVDKYDHEMWENYD